MSGPRSIEVYPREDSAEVAMELSPRLALRLLAASISFSALIREPKKSLQVLSRVLWWRWGQPLARLLKVSL